MEHAGNLMFFIIEEAKESTFDFPQNEIIVNLFFIN